MTFVILEPYQEEMDRTGDERGREIENFPFVATFRFCDGMQKQDLVEIDWRYAQRSGRIPNYYGPARGPLETLPTRFKLVNRRLTGIKADLTNKFYISPTEESWGG